MTRAAKFATLDVNLARAAFGRFQQVNRQRRLEVVPLSGSWPATSAATTTAKTEALKQVAEHLEDVADILESAAGVAGWALWAVGEFTARLQGALGDLERAAADYERELLAAGFRRVKRFVRYASTRILFRLNLTV